MRARASVTLTPAERRWLACQAALQGGSYEPVLRWLVLQARLFERVTRTILAPTGRRAHARSRRRVHGAQANGARGNRVTRNHGTHTSAGVLARRTRPRRNR